MLYLYMCTRMITDKTLHNPDSVCVRKKSNKDIQKVFRLVKGFEIFTQICGKNWWKINIRLSIEAQAQGESVIFKIYCVEYLLKIRIVRIFCVEYFENQSIQQIWDVQNIPQDYFEYSDFQQIFNSSIFWIFAISPCVWSNL